MTSSRGMPPHGRGPHGRLRSPARLAARSSRTSLTTGRCRPMAKITGAEARRLDRPGFAVHHPSPVRSGRGGPMAKAATARKGTTDARIIEIDTERVLARGQHHFAVIDIGSNSIRLVVYDDLSRAPYCRFNEKSFCALGAGLAETGRLAPDAIDHAVNAIDALRGDRGRDAGRDRARPRHRGDAPGQNGGELDRRASATRPGSRCGCSPATRRRPTPRSASSRASSSRRGWPATWAAAASRSPRCSATGSASARSACRSAPCRSGRCSPRASTPPSGGSTRSSTPRCRRC